MGPDFHALKGTPRRCDLARSKAGHTCSGFAAKPRRLFYGFIGAGKFAPFQNRN
jgi:hypothetical protein